MELVSILLPVYNGSRYLSLALDSVIGQTFQNWELIAVDDCSTDDSQAILKSYAARDPRIKVFINPNNLGLFQNYNRCYELASGVYIKPFAQDDLLMPENLDRAVRILQSRPEVSLVLTAKNIIGENSEILETVDLYGQSKGLEPYTKSTILYGSDLITWSLIFLNNYLGEPVVGMFRKASVAVAYDVQYHHIGDLELWFRLLQQGKACYVSEFLCGYRRHKSQASAHRHQQLLDLVDWLKISKKYFTYLKNIGESEEQLQNRLVEVAALHVNHHVNSGLISRDSLSLSPFGRAPAETSTLTQDFAELLFLALRRITPLMATIDEQKHGLAELPILKAKLNSRSHRFVGSMLHVVNSFRGKVNGVELSLLASEKKTVK